MAGEFWMDGYSCGNPDEIRDSLDLLESDVDPDSLYAVLGTFEGEWRVMRFKEFELSEFLDAEREYLKPLAPLSWRSSLDSVEYENYIQEIKEEIEKGWVYQVNACRLLSTVDDLALDRLFAKLRQIHPASSAGYWKCDKWEVASASPETFFRVDIEQESPWITSSPIKGTSRDGNFAKKDTAENVMIVDLMRNDISPLCEPGSVTVPRLLSVEAHPGLFHLVSDVKGRLRSEMTWSELLLRMSPAGSISGAPKSSALEVIDRWERFRGPYCGTMGWIHQGRAHFSVLIRTFFKDLASNPVTTRFGTGAGITWGSDPQGEWQETELKAERLMKIASGRL